MEAKINKQKENQLVAARKKTLSHWNSWSNKSYNGLPVFHHEELSLEGELSTLFDKKYPVLAIVENVLDEENLQDFKLERKDIKTIIPFDELNNLDDIDEEDFRLWMYEDIKCGLGLLNDEVYENAFLLFSEGSGAYAETWRRTFIDVIDEY
jgi:hypothetical protein